MVSFYVSPMRNSGTPAGESEFGTNVVPRGSDVGTLSATCDFFFPLYNMSPSRKLPEAYLGNMHLDRWPRRFNTCQNSAQAKMRG